MAEDLNSQEKFEQVMLGVALLKYIQTHKPNGEDVEKFGEELSTYLNFLVIHYENQIKELLQMKEQLKGYGAKGWYQKRRKRETMKMIDSQIKAFENEKLSIADMMVRI